MCEVPKRSWREALRPNRIVLGLAAVGTLATGVVLGSVSGLVLVGLAAALLLAAVVLPVVREVQFGLPYAVRVVAAVEDRDEQLKAEFTAEKGDLQLCCQLLCDDPDVAARLLEAAWSRAASEWRGPVSSDIRVHVLCLFVHLLTAHQRWAQAPVAEHPTNPLSALPHAERLAVVLSEFAQLSQEDVARLSGRSPEQLSEDLRRAELALAGQSTAGGAG